MSTSMIIGRVVLPAIGITLAAVMAFQALHGGAGGPALPVVLASMSGTSDRSATALDPTILPGQRSPNPPRILAEGHVSPRPGAEVTLGAELAGTITRVLVQEKSVVRQGDLVVDFRGTEIRASAEEAVARVNEIDAELAQIEHDQARTERLPEKQPGREEARERLKSRWNAARARRAAAVSAYRRIEAEFARTRIHAPISGVVVARHVNPGETVGQGAPLLRIVDLGRLRIEAEIDEYDIPRCVTGLQATITAPGHAGESWQGKVEEVADSLMPRRLRPDDPGRPTDTRVLPVRIDFQQPVPLKLGQRVEVVIIEPTTPANPIAVPASGPSPSTLTRAAGGSSPRAERR